MKMQAPLGRRNGASLSRHIDARPRPRWASEAMRRTEEAVACAIHSDVRVMISGEDGTGKKYFARMIHERSRRGSSRFVVAQYPDVASIAPPGVRSDGLFVHELLTRADRGTLLVEDVDRIAEPAQRHLLGFIGSDMAGSGRDVRLITTTTVDLFQRVRADQFREDLFYNLNVIHVRIPALRDRSADIPILFQRFLSVYARTTVAGLSQAAWQRLTGHDWPGNVRELEAVSRWVAALDLARPVEPDDLPSEVGRSW